MDTEYKNSQFDFLNLAIDCCAYVLLIIFWLFAIFLPLLFLGAYLYVGSKAGQFVIILIIALLIIAFILLMLSRGLIYRNRFIMFIVSVVSFYLLFDNIKSILLDENQIWLNIWLSMDYRWQNSY